MKNSKQRTIQVIESFQVSNFGNVILIQSDIDFSGLKNGTILKSSRSDKSWSVKNRIIEFPLIQTVFDNETTINSFLHFTNIEKRTTAEKIAKELNDKNIFQYQVEPILHDKKPEKGEVLKIL